MLEWIGEHREVLWWMGGLSAVTFAGSLIALPVLVARIPADYFLHRKPPPDTWRGQHPIIRYTVRAVKNLFGLMFILAGIAMLLLPGQGIITMLVGVTLLDFPGKRQLELWIVRRRAVLPAINWIRAKTNRPPLELPEPKPRRFALKRKVGATPPSGCALKGPNMSAHGQRPGN